MLNPTILIHTFLKSFSNEKSSATERQTPRCRVDVSLFLTVLHSFARHTVGAASVFSVLRTSPPFVYPQRLSSSSVVRSNPIRNWGKAKGMGTAASIRRTSDDTTHPTEVIAVDGMSGVRERKYVGMIVNKIRTDKDGRIGTSNQCSVCQCFFSREEQGCCMTNCGHTFHTVCLRDWNTLNMRVQLTTHQRPTPCCPVCLIPDVSCRL